ncbi:oxidase or dehydrogenase [Cryptosporidium ubiquitum]|uniref:Oxidase or dehydrogenase n=1 Tax=Cryptosporidium ubiquitum TaxID=857276 RepID=A0A1J4MBV9_9CRYT|nr:oxidase or dehydrogenase [Cryptosporidium ubiquitum]OII70963.1 oxidase or dehydrogenase [Cryptosporidium ubiquitum]
MLNIGRFAGRAWLEPSKFSGRSVIMGFSCLSRRLGKRNINTTRMKYKKDLHPIIEENGVKKNVVDVLIMGGGVTGSALVYLLAKHTNIKSIVFLSDKKEAEKNLIYHLDKTIHSGETDTNADLQHSFRLLKLSNMLRNLVKEFPGGVGNELMEKRNKILLGLGEEENNRIEERFQEFRHFFPKIKLIDGKEISKLEPNIAYLDDFSSKLRKERMNGILLHDEYTSINYDILSALFKKLADEISFRKKSLIRNYVGMNVQSIKRISLDGEVYYKIDSGGKNIYSRFLVINDIGTVFNLVRELGYCSDWIVLNMFGKFQNTVKGELRGIVSGLQSLSCPESTSVYGFPTIGSKNNIRFLASSYTLPISWLLKSMNLSDFSTIRDISSSPFGLFRNIKEKSLRDKIEKLKREVPLLINEQLIQGSRRIIPSLNTNQLKDKQEDFDISINQLLNISGEKNEIILDRSKIHTDENLILNIAQPISGTTCIGSASEDMITICNRLGININENSLKKDIPEYEIHESDFQNDL